MSDYIDRFVLNALVSVLIASWMTWAVDYWSGAIAWLGLAPMWVRLVLGGCAAGSVLFARPSWALTVPHARRYLFFDTKGRSAALKGRAIGLIVGVLSGIAIGKGW
jgi:hypothetical protein